MIAYKSGMYHMRERIRGYQDALEDNQNRFKKAWLKKVRFSNIEPEVKAAINELIAADEPVEALIFATYGLANNGLKYINELRLKVPDDLAIVSFGQAEAFDLYY
jgi:LacI family transcriptional regulator